jgi:hypothetical protein
MKIIDTKKNVPRYVTKNDMVFLMPYLGIRKDGGERYIVMKVYSYNKDGIILNTQCEIEAVVFFSTIDNSITHGHTKYLFDKFDVLPAKDCGISIEF